MKPLLSAVAAGVAHIIKTTNCSATLVCEDGAIVFKVIARPKVQAPV